MTVDVTVQNGSQIIVPVRFRRAVTGAVRIDAPEIDDRGFDQPPRPGLWVTTDARGPQFGMQVGTLARVMVVREDIDGDTSLFATAQRVNFPQFSVEAPQNAPIPPDGIVTLRAIQDSTSGQKLEIRLGAIDGPIIAEAEPHVFSPLTLQVIPHVCTIHRAASAPGAGRRPQLNGAAIDMDRIRDGCNAVFRPAGVRFNFGAVRHHDYFNYTRDDNAMWRGDTSMGSEGHLVSQNRVPNTCNVYFIRYMHNSIGVAVNRDSMASEGFSHPGIIIGVEGHMNDAGTITNRSSAGGVLYQEVIHTLAHEFGHFLSLSHVDRVNSPGRGDTFARRCLMHPNVPLPQTGGNIRFDDIGYGVAGNGLGIPGSLITLKEYPFISTDCEVRRVRQHMRSPRLY